MAKANIETQAGTKISVEGTSEEVAEIVAYMKNKELGGKNISVQPSDESTRKGKRSDSLGAQLMQLKFEGFFDTPRRIVDVEKELKRKAYHYPLPSISTTLIRQVKKGTLGRIKEHNKWSYVKR
ncbi:MAG: hypothetical protein NT157_02345 [Candidatus Micrarchaeota archaeon]|nr:hypothetical protein [Candidatus Micrarchaeota archaeon]